MVVPSAKYYFPDVIRGAQAALLDSGARLVLGISDYSSELEREQIARLIGNGIDGLLVTPSRSMAADPATYLLLQEAPVPVVVVERAIDTARTPLRLSAVRSDHAYGAELAVTHLVAKGHRSIALAWRDSPTAPLVQEGYRRGLDAAGMRSAAIELELTAADAAVDELRRRLNTLLDTCLTHDVDAVIVLPDEAAISLLDVAEDRQVRVPADLVVMAYDDEVASLASVPLTAIAPPKYDVGFLAAQTCLDRVLARARGLPSPVSARVGLLPALSERESSRIPR
ncbi:hypothetical protein ASF63_18635 [Microbacterium sp. Leaf320]|nr:hypothetical protein ASF63_18635 [Microbacterium sp. Leaf320]